MRSRTSILLVLCGVAVLGAAACTKRRAAVGGGEKNAPAVVSGRLISIPGLPLSDAEARLDLDDPAAARDELGGGSTDLRAATGAAPERRVPIALLKVAAHGNFRIERVPPGRYVLRGSAAGHADVRIRFVTAGGETVVTRMRLPRTETLTGRVVDRHSRPVPGTRVLVWSLADAAQSPREATSDGAGAFTFANLGAGLHRVLAQAPGFGPAVRDPIELPGPPLLLVLEGEGRVIAGTVSAAGRPTGGAIVLIAGESLNPPRQTAAAEDGTFRFAGLGPGVYGLRALSGTLASPVAAEVVVGRAPSADGPPPVTLALLPGWTVAGRVVDDRGRPVPAADVRIDAVSQHQNVPDILRADAGARWTSRPLPAGDYQVSARRPGFVARGPVALTLGGAAATPSLTVTLVRAAEIVGRVVDQRGAGLADASVRSWTPGSTDLSVIVDPLPPAAEAAALPSGSPLAAGRGRSVVTDSSGRFTLPDLAPGRFWLDVSRAGQVATRTAPLSLGPGQRLDVGAVTLRDGLRVTGLVVDEAGAPLDGVQVSARGEAKDASPVVASTDRAGQFALAVVPGAYALSFAAGGYVEQTRRIVVSASSPAPALQVRLVRADKTLEGVAKDSGGRPLGDAEVMAWAETASATATPAGPPAASVEAQGRPLSRTTTNPGGFFTLPRLPAARVTLSIKHPDYPTTTVAATPGAFATVVIPIPGRVVGVVHEKVTGAVIDKFRVAARGPDGHVVDGTSRKGGFSLSRLIPGRWTLTVDAPGYSTGAQSVEVPPSTTLGEPSVRDVRVELERR